MSYKISKEEIDDLVQTKYSDKILEIYQKIVEECETNNIPILNNRKNNCSSEFLEMIIDCLDKNKIYEDSIKIENNIKKTYN